MSRKFVLFAFCLLVISNASLGQGGLYVLGGVEFDGINYGYHFQQDNKILSSGVTKRAKDGSLSGCSGTTFAFGVGLHYRFSRLFALETGVSLSEIDLVVHDEYFQNKYGLPTTPHSNFSNVLAEGGNFDFVKWYYGGYISGYIFFDRAQNVVPYLNLGLRYNFLPSGPKYLTGAYTYPTTGEQLIMTGHFADSYFSPFLEFGLRFGGDPGAVWFLGLRYNLAGNMMSSEYTNNQEDKVNYADKVTASGSNFGLTVRVAGLWTPSKQSIYASHKKHKVKSHEKKKLGKSGSKKNPARVPMKVNSLNNQ